MLVADDQTTVREGLVTLLGLTPGIQVVGAAADGAQAIALTAELHPDVVLMDLGMPTIDGVTATARIRAEHPATQVVVLTTFADDTNILAALHAGALGYLTKDAGRAQITRALHTAAAGQAVLDPAVHARLLAAASANTPPPPGAAAALPDGLTVREAEVLALIAAGLTNTQIAGRLFVTEATVKTHINHLFSKTGTHDRAQAVSYAYHHHLTNPPPPSPGTSPMTAGHPYRPSLLPPAAPDDPREVRADSAQNRANGSEIPPPRRSRTRTHPAGRLKIIPVCGRRHGQESQAKFADRQAVLAQSITRAEAAQLLRISDQAVSDRLTAGDLVGLKDGRVRRLPAWQFDADTANGWLPGISQLRTHFPGGPVTLTTWATTPNVDLRDQTPAARLAARRRRPGPPRRPGHRTDRAVAAPTAPTRPCPPGPDHHPGMACPTTRHPRQRPRTYHPTAHVRTAPTATPTAPRGLARNGRGGRVSTGAGGMASASRSPGRGQCPSPWSTYIVSGRRRARRGLGAAR